MNENLRLKYNANSCMYRDNKTKEEIIKILGLYTIYSEQNITKLLEYIRYNVTTLCININNNYIYIKLMKNYYECDIIDGNYEFFYLSKNPNLSMSDKLVEIIKKHNFLTNTNLLFNIIKHKLCILKEYFICINDIYIYILPIIIQTHLDDDDIFLRLFFEQDVKVKYSV